MSDYKKPFQSLVPIVPLNYRNAVNSSMLANVFDKNLTHEEAVKLYGLIGKYYPDSSDSRPWISQINTERELNMLTQLITVSHGSDEFIFSFDDILNKAKITGVNVNDVASWNSSQAFNFAPPINLDKFVNFSSYYWVQTVPSLWNPSMLPEYYVIKKTVGAVSDWATGNYWVHKNDLYLFNTTINGAVLQASRPIIEYSADIEQIALTKTRFNQTPLFQLYWLDGTKTDWTSSIFYYVEDPEADLDLKLQRRVKANKNGNFYFGQGTISPNNKILGFKQNGIINTCWVAGPETSQASVLLLDTASTGCLTDISVDPILPNQTWTVLPIFNHSGITSFSVTGSKSGSFPNAIVGQAYSHNGLTFNLHNKQFGFTENTSFVFISGINVDSNVYTEKFEVKAITSTTFSIKGSKSGSFVNAIVGQHYTNSFFDFDFDYALINYTPGQIFTLHINAPEHPRYVIKDNNKLPITLAGGISADTTNQGCWLTPPQLVYNPELENRTEILHGDLTNHFTSIINAQPNLVGSKFGSNNYGKMNANTGFGGTIKTLMGNTNLFYALQNQNDLSPLSILDFAEQQYAIALNSVSDFLITLLPETLAITGNSSMASLFEQYELNYANKSEILNTFRDTTSPIKNWPLTLPLIGMVPGVQPQITFDTDLGVYVLAHHDGHESPLAVHDRMFEQNLARGFVDRYDGQNTQGTVGLAQPLNPYKGQLWYDTTSDVLKYFKVAFEGPAVPVNPLVNDYWYNRITNSLKQWDGIQWSSTTVFPWEEIAVEVLTNSLIFFIENKLYQHYLLLNEYNTATSNYILKSDNDRLQYELSKFAIAESYDPLGANYNASDAFTWNYSNAIFSPALNITGTHARWHTLYKEYFLQFTGGIELVRPDVEPWKLLGYANKPGNWDSTYRSPTPDRIWLASMWDLILTTHPTIKLCVDISNDNLLPPYVSPTSPNNQYALLFAIPSGISNTYNFGDEGPVELVWRKSISFNYARARVGYQLDPVKFLSTFWGFQKFNLDGLEIDKTTGQFLTHKNFTLHSEPKVFNNESVSTIVVIPSIDCNFTLDNLILTAFYSDATNTILFKSDTFVIKTGEIVNINSTLAKTNSINNVITLQIKENGNFINVGDKFIVSFDGANITTRYIPSNIVIFNGLNQLYSQFLKYNSLSASSSNLSLFRKWKVQLGYRTSTLLESDNLKLKHDLYDTIPDTAYKLKLNKSSLAKDLWIQALRVQITKIGTSKILNKDTNGEIIYQPVNEGIDWEFRIENYFARHPQIELYEYDTNDIYETFNALSAEHSQDEWVNYQIPTNIKTVNLPVNITGIQNVINFIHGYAHLLEDRGFAFGQGDDPYNDPSTGRIANWQFEQEHFIDKVYSGTKVNSGYTINPFLKKFWLYTPQGLPANLLQHRFDDIRTSQFAFDVMGDIMSTKSISLIRFDDHTEITSDIPLFGMHLTLDKYEHVILFNNYVSENSGVLFDSFLGLSIDKLHLIAQAQTDFKFRPTFGGFFLRDHDFRKNIVSSIDDVANYYNTNKLFETSTITRHALALIGFTHKDYFTNLDTTEKSEFNFWRALINAKGTNYSIDAFLNSSKFEFAEVDEFWAYKIAEYGDARTHVFPELKLDSHDCLLKHTRLFFEDGVSTNIPSASSIVISPTDEDRWFAINDLNTKLYFEPEINETTIIITTDNEIVTLPIADKIKLISGPVGGNFINITNNTLEFNIPGEYLISSILPPKPQFSPIKLIDYVDRAVIEDITVWHPAIGNHTAIALEVINMITDNDPAKYSYSVLTNSNTSYDPARAWGEREVGRTWWDTTNLSYIPYYDEYIFPSYEERLARWGSLAEYSNINVYEWISSDVPPTEYDAIAKVEQLSADVDNNIKKTGIAARKQSYKRTRNWFTRPVAWSYVSNPAASQGGTDTILALKSGTTALTLNDIELGTTSVIMDSGTFAMHDISVGSRICAWLDDKPYGELELTGSAKYLIGNEGLNGTADTSVVFEGLNIFDLVSITWTDNKNFIGSAIGNISFTFFQANSLYYATATEDTSGVTSTIQIETYTGLIGDYVILDFSKLGIKLQALLAVNTALDADIANELTSIGLSVVIRQYYDAIIHIPFPDNILDNPVLYPPLPDTYGWRAWNIPTQTQLTNDLIEPYNNWAPIYGDWVSVVSNRLILDDVAEYDKAKLVLNDDTTVIKYKSTWNNWEVLGEERHKLIGNNLERSIIFTNKIDSTRLAVYVNGINQLPSFYKIDIITNTLTINAVTTGHEIVVIQSSYEPSQKDLAFDPDIEENVSIQIQYKTDYQYSTQNIRDYDGNITGKKYYFWVKGKSVPVGTKTLSAQQAETLLKTGPASYITFQELTDADSNLPIRYKGLTIAGLNMMITKDNTFKLRFTRDFTLRDDPNQIDLKNVHQEWMLLRKNQTTKIPQLLWNKLVDSAAGENILGNQLPSINRVLYDERHNARSRYGFGDDQVLAERSLIIGSLKNTLINPKTCIYRNGINMPVTFKGINIADSENWFATSISTRRILDFVWRTALPQQINELFFEVLNDALSNNYEFTDIFKTSRLSAHSIATIKPDYKINNADVYY